MQLNNALWILVIGMIFEILVLVFVVVFVITQRSWMIKSFSNCMTKMKEVEREMETIKKVNINIGEVKEILTEVEKIIKK
jgi:hypothetical protein